MKKLLLALVSFLCSSQSFANALFDAYKAFRDKDYAKAESKFEEELQKQPKDATLLYNKGLTLLLQKKFPESQALFHQAEQAAKPALKGQILFNRSLASIAQGQWDEAEKDLLSALAYDNESKQIQENLAWVREQKKRQKPPEDEKKDQQNGEKKDQQNDEKKDQQNGEKKDQQNDEKKDQQNGEKKDQQNSQSDSEQKPEKAMPQDAEKQAASQSQAPESKDVKNAGKKVPDVMTVKELEKQEAEKLLRSLDDKIGRYPLQEWQGEKSRRSHGKEW